MVVAPRTVARVPSPVQNKIDTNAKSGRVVINN